MPEDTPALETGKLYYTALISSTALYLCALHVYLNLSTHY